MFLENTQAFHLWNTEQNIIKKRWFRSFGVFYFKISTLVYPVVVRPRQPQ